MRSKTIVPAVMLLLTFLFVFLAPIPDLDTIVQLLPLWSPKSDQALVEVGNSVVTAISSCDNDKRDLSAIFTDDLGHATVDLSNPGQEFEKSLNFATIALKHSKTSGAVFYLSSFELTQHTLPNFQTGSFLRLASSSNYNANSMKARVVARSPLGSMDREDSPFEYGGVSYPKYQGLKDIYYTVEASQTKCPEDLGFNHQFIEALYWKSYMQHAVRQDHLVDLVTLGRIAKSLHKPLLVVLLPVDFDDISSLNPSLSDAIHERLRFIAGNLRASGINVLDLSQSLRPDAFVGRWCACGHLTQDGRKQVAAEAVHAYRNLSQYEDRRASN